MTGALPPGGPIHQASIDLSPQIPLHVYLIRGAEFAVWIDSGIKVMFPGLLETMATAGVGRGDLRFVLHTHSHHDHIGCNAQLKQETGCLIAAHPYYAAWHGDYERHFQEFARPFPHLVPDTPELRDEVFGFLDAPHHVDLYIDEGVRFDLGGGVTLESLFLPGHMMAELGWLEGSTRTLIIGDAITGLDWPLFHSHLTVQGYRSTLRKIRAILRERGVERVLLAHFPPMAPEEVETLLEQAAAYIDAIEVTILRILARGSTTTLEELWAGTCAEMGRIREFRGLNTVHAHVQDLIARVVVREVSPERYALR